jgi:hypothetical protein
VFNSNRCFMSSRSSNLAPTVTIHRSRRFLGSLNDLHLNMNN